MESFLATVAELNSPDQRAFLYSDLDRQKVDNPDGYKEAVEFWTRLLSRACQRGLLSTTAPRDSATDSDNESEEEDVLGRIRNAPVDMPSVLTVDRRLLTLRLVFRGDTPMGLDSVLDEMLRTGVLVPTDDFFAPPLRRWANWLATRLLPRGIASRGPSAVLVATRSLPEVAARVLAAHRSCISCPLTDNIMSVDEFRRAYYRALVPDESSKSKYTAMNITDAHILLKHLVDARHAVTSAQLTAHPPTSSSAAGHEARGTDLVKFAMTAASLAITDTDFATYQVLCTHRLLAQQVSALETRIAELDAQVREALRRQQRPIAAARLRLKRHIESNVLTKRMAALETVEHVVLQLQQTSTDIQLMQTLSAGTLALRALNNEAKEIDPDKVADAWEEEAAHAAELGAALEDTQAVVLPDDLDVEAELEALIAVESAKDTESKDAESKDTEPVDDAVDALADSIGKVEITAKDPDAISNDEQQEEESKVAVPAE
ncbi:hypothetical protein LPJ60_002554 [Coemansia sp. RSA 2675]|nr:hypothetical protein LPJ60_002554 [Coemansia sp. RSA 2675]